MILLSNFLYIFLVLRNSSKIKSLKLCYIIIAILCYDVPVYDPSSLRLYLALILVLVDLKKDEIDIRLTYLMYKIKYIQHAKIILVWIVIVYIISIQMSRSKRISVRGTIRTHELLRNCTLNREPLTWLGNSRCWFDYCLIKYSPICNSLNFYSKNRFQDRNRRNLKYII